MTFSIVGFDPDTQELGVAVASKFLACGSLVPFAQAGVGAIASQSWVNLDYGSKGLELLAQGLTPEQVLQQLTAADEGQAVRQVGIVDAQGRSFTFTGADCHAWAGGITGPNFACQGNILVSEETVQRMSQAFQTAPGDLADRLLHALLAGDRAGGDSRGRQAAGILVVKEKGGYGGYNDRFVDLRVDDHPDPVPELLRLYELHKLYLQKTKPEDILQIDSSLKNKLTGLLYSLGYLQTPTPEDKEFNAQLEAFHLIENFDERILAPGQIDRKVLEYLETMAQAKNS